MSYSRTTGSYRQKILFLYGPLTIFFLFFPVFIFSKPATGTEVHSRVGKTDKVLVLFLGGLSLTDWQAAEAPNIRALTEQGAVGIMNVRSAGSFTPDNEIGRASCRE